MPLPVGSLETRVSIRESLREHGELQLQAKGLSDRVLVDFQAISSCLRCVQEAENLLATARKPLSEWIGEEKVHDHAKGNVVCSSESSTGLGADSDRQWAYHDIARETTTAASKWRLKDPELAKHCEAPTSTPTTAGSLDILQPPKDKDDQHNKPGMKSSKWSSIDRQGLVDQVVINGISLENSGSAAKKDDNMVVHKDSRASDEMDMMKATTFASDVEFVPVLWGRLRIPIIHPSSQFRLIWLMIGLGFMFYEAYAIPFYLAYDLQPSGFLYYLVSVVNGYFLMDIVASCITGYVDDKTGQIVLDPVRILYRYLSCWFVLDCIAGIPWEWVNADAETAKFTRGIRFVRAFRLLRLTRLLRLLRTNAFMERIEIFIEANQVFMFMFGLMRILFMLFGVTHWMACAWYALGMQKTTEMTWVERYLSHLEQDEKVERYLYSLYFTLTTMTTVGYGDMSAQNFQETCFVLCLLLVASIVFAGLMGVLTDLISNLNVEKNAKNDRKAQLSRYMRWRAVPKDLFITIRQHILFLWDENEGYDTYEEDIKQQLSPALKTELCFHIYGRLLYSSPFFTWMRDYSECLKQLSTMVQSLFLSKGDIMFRVGQTNDQIYLLISGCVWLSRNQSLFSNTAAGESLSQDIVGGSGMHGFSIPRHRDGGFTDVGKMIVKKAVPIRRTQDMANKTEAVLHMWKKTAVPGPGNPLKMRMDEVNEMSDEGHTQGHGLPLRPSRPKRESTEDLVDSGGPMSPRGSKKRYMGMAYTGNPIFDSPVLMEATVQLKRRDLREKKAAVTIQRCWRWVAQSPQYQLAKNAKKPKTKGLRNKANAMASKTINAPAYFGESCLWVPYDQWGKEDPPLYTYTVRCDSRCELVYIARDAIHEIVERFSPWLGERLESFRQSVLGQLRRALKDSATTPRGEAIAHSESDQACVDWATVDTLISPQDDQAIGAMHCKTLLRTAGPARVPMQMHWSPSVNARAAATHTRPAMPRVSTRDSAEENRSSRRFGRLNSGVEGRRSRRMSIADGSLV